MQNIRHMLEAMESGVSADAVFMQLVEGIGKTTDNTIGIEIEMANEAAPSGGNTKGALETAFDLLKQLRMEYKRLFIGLKEKLDLFPLDKTKMSDKLIKYAFDFAAFLSKQWESHIKSDLYYKLQNKLSWNDKNELLWTIADRLDLIRINKLYSNWLEDLQDISLDAEYPVKKEQALKDFLVLKARMESAISDLGKFQANFDSTMQDTKFQDLFKPEEGAVIDPYDAFRDSFGAIGWEVKNDSSIKPHGLEAATPDGGFAITDFAKIKKGFEVAEKLHEYGWHFNETTGVHFHLGVNKNIDFFYIIAMIALFYQKESFIFANFPMREKNVFAHSMEDIVKKIKNKLLLLHSAGDNEAIELADSDLQKILDSLPVGDRYFGVNARPALAQHGTIELRYFHGQPLLDKPALLPRLIALFRSIMHEAQTSRYFAIPEIEGTKKLFLERDAQDRIWIKTEINRKENPNVRLPIVPKYIALKQDYMEINRPAIKLNSFLNNKDKPKITYPMFAQLQKDLLHITSQKQPENIAPEKLNELRTNMEILLHFVSIETNMLALSFKEKRKQIETLLQIALNAEATQKPEEYIPAFKSLLKFMLTELNIP